MLMLFLLLILAGASRPSPDLKSTVDHSVKVFSLPCNMGMLYDLYGTVMVVHMHQRDIFLGDRDASNANKIYFMNDTVERMY